jgi:hypothetical protein
MDVLVKLSNVKNVILIRCTITNASVPSDHVQKSSVFVSADTIDNCNYALIFSEVTHIVDNVSIGGCGLYMKTKIFDKCIIAPLDATNHVMYFTRHNMNNVKFVCAKNVVGMQTNNTEQHNLVIDLESSLDDTKCKCAFHRSVDDIKSQSDYERCLLFMMRQKQHVFFDYMDRTVYNKFTGWLDSGMDGLEKCASDVAKARIKCVQRIRNSKGCIQQIKSEAMGNNPFVSYYIKNMNEQWNAFSTSIGPCAYNMYLMYPHKHAEMIMQHIFVAMTAPEGNDHFSYATLRNIFGELPIASGSQSLPSTADIERQIDTAPVENRANIFFDACRMYIRRDEQFKDKYRMVVYDVNLASYVYNAFDIRVARISGFLDKGNENDVTLTDVAARVADNDEMYYMYVQDSTRLKQEIKTHILVVEGDNYDTIMPNIKFMYLWVRVGHLTKNVDKLISAANIQNVILTMKQNSGNHIILTDNVKKFNHFIVDHETAAMISSKVKVKYLTICNLNVSTDLKIAAFDVDKTGVNPNISVCMSYDSKLNRTNIQMNRLGRIVNVKNVVESLQDHPKNIMVADAPPAPPVDLGSRGMHDYKLETAIGMHVAKYPYTDELDVKSLNTHTAFCVANINAKCDKDERNTTRQDLFFIENSICRDRKEVLSVVKSMQAARQNAK